MTEISYAYISVKQASGNILLTKIPAGVLTAISYLAVRGKNKEPSAIQRLLNPRRIASIKQFTLNGGDYPSSIILNWVKTDNPLKRSNNMLAFSNISDTAQVIDGQHRLAGIKAAISENKEIENLEIPVAIYENLSTKQCADIFLSINTEQKPVPRSLVFDLYGIASEELIDPAALRARDIAVSLNETEDSPYFDNIKFPGGTIRRGGIALSTAVTAIKPLVEEKGNFEQIGVSELEIQKQAVLNFFLALEQKYEEQWAKKDNAFQYASGFIGAMDFFRLKMLPYCNSKKSFKVEAMGKVINLAWDNLILQEEVKGLGGKEGPSSLSDLMSPKNVASRNVIYCIYSFRGNFGATLAPNSMQKLYI